MKNPLFWLYSLPKQYFYFLMYSWFIYTSIDFMIDHPEHIFLYYIMISLGIFYLINIVYYLINFNNRKYHNIIFMMSTLLFFLSLCIKGIIYPNHGNFSIYYSITVGCLIIALILFTIIKHQRFIDDNS